MNLEEIENIRLYIQAECLDGKCRKRGLVDQRSYLYHMLRKEAGMTLVKIGEMFNKDHATIMHGLKSYEALKDSKLFIVNTSKIADYVFSVVNTSNLYNNMVRSYDSLRLIDKKIV